MNQKNCLKMNEIKLNTLCLIIRKKKLIDYFENKIMKNSKRSVILK